MKEYRIKPELVNQVLIDRLIYFFRIMVVAAIVVVLYTYYLHPRTQPYESWSEYFNSSSVKFTGVLGLAAILLPMLWGFTMGKKNLKKLVIMAHNDSISWKTADDKERKIFFHDMIRQKDSTGMVLKSKSDKRLVLMVPKRIDDYEELKNMIDVNLVTGS